MLDSKSISDKATLLRKKLNVVAFAPIDIFALSLSIDELTLVKVPLSDGVSGCCIKNGPVNFIVINSNHTLGRQRYSLAHEFYHLFYDSEMKTYICQDLNSKIKSEQEANMFASYFLMPSIVESTLTKDAMTLDNVIRLEQTYGLSRSAMLWRLYDAGLITESQKIEYIKNIKYSARKAGYSTTLYEPSGEKERYSLCGRYIKDVEQLYASKKISAGKYEEYLLDAFCEDIVYGLNDKEAELVD